MRISKVIAILLLVVSIVLAIVSVIVLPETVITQVSFSSSNVSTMPKWGAVLLPTSLGVGFSMAALLSKKEMQTTAKYLLVSAVGVFAFVIELIVNS